MVIRAFSAAAVKKKLPQSRSFAEGLYKGLSAVGVLV